MKQSRLYDPKSPFLIGNYEKSDSIHDVPQQSWVDGQMSLFQSFVDSKCSATYTEKHIE